MLGELAGFSGDDVIRILQKLGFSIARQKGSHVVLRKEIPVKAVGTVVPKHKELAVGTLRSILRQAGVSTEDFLRHK